MASFKDRHGTAVPETGNEPFIYAGEELTDERAEDIAQDALSDRRRRNLVPGGKSLSGEGAHSPTVQFRVPAELRHKLEARAKEEHRSASKIARDALEQYLRG